MSSSIQDKIDSVVYFKGDEMEMETNVTDFDRIEDTGMQLAFSL
jgi:hypothetical protein